MQEALSLAKIGELNGIAEAKHPDIIWIVESWLSNEIQDNELVINNITSWLD